MVMLRGGIKRDARKSSGGWPREIVLVLVVVLVLGGREPVRSPSSPYRPPGSEDEHEHGEEDDISLSIGDLIL